MKPLDIISTAHNLQSPVTDPLCPRYQLASVTTISPVRNGDKSTPNNGLKSPPNNG